MRRGTLFALVAMLPAALNGAAASAGRSMLVPICSGDGLVRMAEVPLDEPRLPGSDPAGCCAKGCHGSSSRKRGCGTPEPAA
jgi:hypothetical protein